MRTRLTLILTTLCSSILLQGCTTSVVDPVAGTPTMKEAYYGAMQDNDHVINHDLANGGLARNEDKISGASSLTIVRGNAITLPDQRGVLQSAQVTKAQADIDHGFALLPNPQVVVYLYPHYEGVQQMPIHGNWTTFPLYKTNHYALPSEVQT